MRPLYAVQGLVLFAVLLCCAPPPPDALGQSCASARAGGTKKAEKKLLTLKDACRVLLRELKIPKDSKLGKRLVASDLDYNKVTKSYWVYGKLDIDLRK